MINIKDAIQKARANKQVKKFMKLLKLSTEEFVDIIIFYNPEIKKILEEKDEGFKRYSLIEYFKKLGESEKPHPIGEKVKEKVVK